MHFFPYTSLPFIFSNRLYHVHAYNIFLFPVENKNKKIAKFQFCFCTTVSSRNMPPSNKHPPPSLTSKVLHRYFSPCKRPVSSVFRECLVNFWFSSRGGSAGIRISYTYVTSSGDIRYVMRLSYNERVVLDVRFRHHLFQAAFMQTTYPSRYVYFRSRVDTSVETDVTAPVGT